MTRFLPFLRSVLFLAALTAPGTVWAQSSGTNAFRITGVQVEAVANTSAAARDKAVSDGRAAALRQLMERLTMPEDHARLPEAPADALDAMITGTQVEEEQIGPTRYVGRITYIFDGDKVGELLQAAGIPYVQVASQPMLVLPVTVDESGQPALWDEPNPWREAWTRRDWENRLVPFVDPLGDLQDLQAISAAQVVEGDRGALRLIAGRYEAGFVLSAIAAPIDGGSMQITLRRFNVLTGQSEDLGTRQVAGGEQALSEAANAIAREIEQTWKRANLVQAGQRETILAQVPIQNYGYWVRLQRNLAQVSLVQESRVMNLTPAEARIEITYVGSIEQLQAALGQVGLVLTESAASGDPGDDTGYRESTRETDPESATDDRPAEGRSTDDLDLDGDGVVTESEAAEAERRRLFEDPVRENNGTLRDGESVESRQADPDGAGQYDGGVQAAPRWILTLGASGNPNP